MISGKGPLIAVRNSISRMDSIYLSNWSRYDENTHSRYISYMVDFMWDDGIKFNSDLRNPYMRSIIQWALSSVKKVGIFIGGSLPIDVIELLLGNPSFTKLELDGCDFSTLQLLTEFKKFDYIRASSRILESLNNVRIVTKKLEFVGVCLKDILKLRSIKTNLLITSYSNFCLNDSLLTVDVGPGFQFLEKLELTVQDERILSDSEKFLKFLESLNTKLDKLELLKFTFHKHDSYLTYNRDQELFNALCDSLKNLEDFEGKMIVYEGRVKVELNCSISSVISCSKQVFESYCETLKKEFQSFEHPSCLTAERSYHGFNKSRNVTKNFEVNTQLRLSFI
ncbi:hypothetical protein FO519_008848 [Halicephalobus sp. NKZ332]|nr:hypothetical protein FO519_008848 [Halicephalobus sp. NKZ332]